MNKNVLELGAFSIDCFRMFELNQNDLRVPSVVLALINTRNKIVIHRDNIISVEHHFPQNHVD